MRVLAQVPLGVVEPDGAQQLDGLRAGARGLDQLVVQPQRLGEEVADPAHRVDAGARVLEDHRHLASGAARGVAPGRRRARRGRRRRTRPVDLGAVRAGGRGPCGRSPTCRSRTRRRARRSRPASTRRRHLVEDRPLGPPGQAQRQVASISSSGHQRSRPAIRSASSSPTMLKATTTMTIATAGATAESGCPSEDRAPALVDHGAPVGRRRLDAEARGTTARRGRAATYPKFRVDCASTVGDDVGQHPTRPRCAPGRSPAPGRPRRTAGPWPASTRLRTSRATNGV